MVDTEIWLRLMSISSLYGDDMVRIAHWLAKQSQIECGWIAANRAYIAAGTTLSFISAKEYRKLTLLVGATQPSFNPCGQRILSSSTSGDDRLPRRTVC